jgi:hypothetical protein
LEHREEDAKMFFYNQAEVNGIKKNIADLWLQSSRNVLQMGLCLEDLRLGMPSTDFSAYLKNEISRMGISRSIAYRWIVLSQELSILFPNRHVYEALVRLDQRSRHLRRVYGFQCAPAGGLGPFGGNDSISPGSSYPCSAGGPFHAARTARGG